MLHSHHTLLHSDDIWGTLQLLLHTLSVQSQVVPLTKKSSLTAYWLGPNRNHLPKTGENVFQKGFGGGSKRGKIRFSMALNHWIFRGMFFQSKPAQASVDCRANAHLSAHTLLGAELKWKRCPI
jgi:hypothetical protein